MILETQAGEGNDLFTTLPELVELYKSFNDTSRLKICIDSAHVWAVGYNPYMFLLEILEMIPSSIQLIHFNDSACHRGSRKDRHASVGNGYIGELIMGMMYSLANKNKIHMVTE